MLPHHEKNWGDHPAVPTGDQLTFGDRAADIMRSGMGSWAFIWCALGFLAVWITAAQLGAPIDNPQLTILNLGLSCLAALQGGILLIAAKRQDAINAALAAHDRELLALLVQINKSQTEILEAVHKHLGITTEGTTP